MTITEMRQVLAGRNIQLTKSLGQNFLFDQNQLKKIVSTAEVSLQDKILEIGPGLGPLTELLVENAASVLAIEKDIRLVAVLNERFAALVSAQKLKLVHADALACLRERQQDWTGWKLVSNLPYSVASPILVELGQAERPPERLVATLQIEVAQRLVAGSGSPQYGVLSLLVQLAYEPQGWFKIPATCFFPEPDVDSACVCLIKRRQPLIEPAQRVLFAKIVKHAFSQRRKMMFKLLKNHWPAEQLRAAFAAAQIAPEARAESVALPQFVILSRHLASEPPKEDSR